MNVDFDTLLKGLDGLTEEAGKHVRAAAQVGAQVFYDEVLARVPVGENAHYFYGKNQKYLFPAGTLRNSIYQVYSDDQSKTGTKATYHVAWNHQKAPYGFMVEFGTSSAPAHPFLRPAFTAIERQALDASNEAFVNLMRSGTK